MDREVFVSLVANSGHGVENRAWRSQDPYAVPGFTYAVPEPLMRFLGPHSSLVTQGGGKLVSSFLASIAEVYGTTSLSR